MKLQRQVAAFPGGCKHNIDFTPRSTDIIGSIVQNIPGKWVFRQLVSTQRQFCTGPSFVAQLLQHNSARHC